MIGISIFPHDTRLIQQLYRCPTECRLANSTGTWKCIVSLRFIKDAKGQLLGMARNEQFGEVIYDKAEVEERLRRAQRAILNPSRRSTDFLEGDDEDVTDNQLSFSTNFVSLQISGPGVADLSFCDLPGMCIFHFSGAQVLTFFRFDCKRWKYRKRRRHQSCQNIGGIIHFQTELSDSLDRRVRE